MATLNDICTLVPALLDDKEKSVFDATFIFPYVNAAQRTIVQRLLSASVPEVKFRQSPVLIPAGTTTWGHNSANIVPPNLLLNSETFDFTPVTGNWSPGSYDTPTVTLATSPYSTSVAYNLNFAAATQHEMLATSVVTLPANATSNFITGAISLQVPSGQTPYTVTVAVGVDGANETSFELNLTSDWKRVAVTAGPVASGAASYGTLRVSFPSLAGLQCNVSRAQLAYTMEDAGYSATTTLPLQAAVVPTLPRNLTVPDDLWEAKLGATQAEYFRCYGPSALPAQAPANSLGYWDWSGNEIHFVGSTEDRLVRLDYYGSLDDFVSPSQVDQAVLINNSVNAISFLVAAHIATSRGQHQLAQTFFQQADTEIDAIINVEIKSQQQQPDRRQPYRGRGRYQGYFRGAY